MLMVPPDPGADYPDEGMPLYQQVFCHLLQLCLTLCAHLRVRS